MNTTPVNAKNMLHAPNNPKKKTLTPHVLVVQILHLEEEDNK